MKRLICLIKGHNWIYILWNWKLNSECMERQCWRCDKKEKLRYELGVK